MAEKKTKRKDSKRVVLKPGESQRPNGTYEFRWTDSRGGRHSIYAKTLVALREKEIEVEKAKLNDINADGMYVTLDDLYQTWLQIKRGVKPNTMDGYRQVYIHNIQPVFGQMKVTAIKKNTIRKFYLNLHEQNNLKFNTLLAINNVFKQILDIAVDDNYLVSNPTDDSLKDVRKVTRGQFKQRLSLTEMQQQRLIDFLANDPHYCRHLPLITVMLGTGLRAGEAVSLRWCDIDFEQNVININHTIVKCKQYDEDGNHHWETVIHSPKTRTSYRTIPMFPAVREALEEERRWQQSQRFTTKYEIDGYTDFVFLTVLGTPQTMQNLNHALNRIVLACNQDTTDKRMSNEYLLPKFSSHILRHTFATRMCEAGMHIKVVQDALGHADAAMTLNTYTDTKSAFKQRQFEQMSEAFEKLNGVSQLTPKLTPKLTPIETHAM